MSDLTSTSYGKDYSGSGKCDSGNNSMLMILLLLFLCGGDGGLFGGSCGNGGGSCGIGGGMDGILPLILILCLCGGF
ncbi:MAG: chorion class high-cysteine HCB protein 13 [Anaerolineaceae bacterium]|nr:MAG: chorion class high-cysteine HCB protein 13 [Anaerolineaceae bacterium]